MLGDRQNCQDHRKFKKISALAGTSTLTPGKMLELNAHVENCEECHAVTRQYLILKAQGIPTLAATYFEHGEQPTWDEASTRQKLFARIRADVSKQSKSSPDPTPAAFAAVGKLALRTLRVLRSAFSPHKNVTTTLVHLSLAPRIDR